MKAAEAKAVASDADFRVVGIEWLVESKTNPRRVFPKDALADLTKSIAEKGVLVPLLVRPRLTLSGNPEDRNYEILAGARRYRAAQAAGLKALPVLVRELDDTAALEVQVIENLQRTDIHPLEEAEGYKQLLERGKYEIADLAAKVGKSESYIYQRLKLAELIPAAKKAFQEETISAGHAILIARLQPAQQKETLEYATDDYDKPSVRDLAEWIQQEIFLDLHSAAFPKDKANLVPGVVACVDCPKRTGFAPALFADVKKKDTCTDSDCFHKKATAFVQLQVSEAKQGGEELLQLSDEYGSAKKGISRDLWQDFEHKPAKCPSAEQGVVIEGRSQGRVFSICRDKDCKMHGKLARQTAAAGTRDPYREERLRSERKRREQLELRRRILRAIAEVPARPIAKLTDQHLQLIMSWALGRLWHDAEVALCQALNIEPVVRKSSWGGANHKDYGAALKSTLKDRTGPQLAKWLTLFAAGSDLLIGSYEVNSEKKALGQLAALEGVKVAPIEKAFKAELAAKKTKKPRQAKAKKKAA